MNGYDGILTSGQCVSVKTGNMQGPTMANLAARVAGLPPYTCTLTPLSDPPNNKRLAIVPAFDNLNFSGKQQICIKAFYVVVLYDVDVKNGTVTAVFHHSYQGTQVDPGTAPLAGQLHAAALVK